MPEIDENIQRERERYFRAVRVLQWAIAFQMKQPGYRLTELEPMRVGIDISRAEVSGLAELLIAKGVFTELEYVTAIGDAIERELGMQAGGLPAEFWDRVRGL